jgi:hypothetical protein
MKQNKQTTTYHNHAVSLSAHLRRFSQHTTAMSGPASHVVAIHEKLGTALTAMSAMVTKKQRIGKSHPRISK